MQIPHQEQHTIEPHVRPFRPPLNVAQQAAVSEPSPAFPPRSSSNRTVN